MQNEKFSFKVLNEDGLARNGIINTRRGNIDTPVFMPVGTQGTVKATFIEDIIKTQFLLVNCFNLK